MAVKGTTGMLTGAALGAVGAGAGALPGAGVGAAMGLLRGALSGTAQVIHEEFITKMAHHSAKRALARGVSQAKREATSTEKKPRTPKAAASLGGAHNVAEAIQRRKSAAKSATLAGRVKNAQFEAKHRRVHGRFV